MNSREHWERIYNAKSATEVSWYQREPTCSVELIRRVARDRSGVIFDIGGGASTLVDFLLAEGYRGVTVLDLAAPALARARNRLKERAGLAGWVCADVLSFPLAVSSVDVWHDRAVFHFLTAPEDRRRYVANVECAVRPGGAVIVATFASDGPTKCSGLEVARYGSTELQAEFGPRFELVDGLRELHRTPSGAVQAFQYCLCRLKPAASAGARPGSEVFPRSGHSPRIEQSD